MVCFQEGIDVLVLSALYISHTLELQGNFEAFDRALFCCQNLLDKVPSFIHVLIFPLFSWQPNVE